MSLGHVTIRVEQKLHRAGTGPQPGQVRSGINVTAHYGPMSHDGPDKRTAVKKMIENLRSMYASGNLQQDIACPQAFLSLQKCPVPEAVLASGVGDLIDWNLIRFEDPEE